MTPDNTFFTLKCWRISSAEQQYVHKVYAANLLTPRERRTLAAYHSATYLRLNAYQKHFQMIEQLLASITLEFDKPTNEAQTALLIELENNCNGAVRMAWSVFDSLAHEINLICWRQANRKRLFHPYVSEKKISFYTVRERLLATDKLKDSQICQLLVKETRDPEEKSPQYMLLSNLASRALHRPLLLGCRWQSATDGQPLRILLTDSEGMPGDRAVNLHDVDILSSISEIDKWLTEFIDQIYLALSDKL